MTILRQHKSGLPSVGTLSLEILFRVLSQMALDAICMQIIMGCFNCYEIARVSEFVWNIKQLGI